MNFAFHSLLDSNYRNALSEGVLRLQESGKLAALKIKWWNEKKGGGACSVSILYVLMLLFSVSLSLFFSLPNLDEIKKFDVSIYMLK